MMAILHPVEGKIRRFQKRFPNQNHQFFSSFKGEFRDHWHRSRLEHSQRRRDGLVLVARPFCWSRNMLPAHGGTKHIEKQLVFLELEDVSGWVMDNWVVLCEFQPYWPFLTPFWGFNLFPGKFIFRRVHVLTCASLITPRNCCVISYIYIYIDINIPRFASFPPWWNVRWVWGCWSFFSLWFTLLQLGCKRFEDLINGLMMLNSLDDDS